MSRGLGPITINFSSTDHRKLSWISAGLIAAAVILCVLAAVMLLRTRSYRAEASVLERDAAALARSLDAYTPVIEERQRLNRELGAMTALLDARDLSWVGILTALEGAVPPGAALHGFSFSAKDGVVDLEGIAQSPEALSGLMIGLERSASFQNPQLKRQSLDKGILAFHVQVIYHAAAGGGTVHGSARKGR